MSILLRAAVVAGAIITLAACGSDTVTSAPPTTSEPEFDWGPAPAVFPAGAELAVLQGDPHSTGEFTVRLRMPDGYRIPPHTHPTDENVTVVSGAFLVGMGATFKADSMVALPTGGFVTAPAGHAHFAEARGATVVQVHAMGPFALTYVNTVDAPHAIRR